MYAFSPCKDPIERIFNFILSHLPDYTVNKKKEAKFSSIIFICLWFTIVLVFQLSEQLRRLSSRKQRLAPILLKTIHQRSSTEKNCHFLCSQRQH